jgi:competence protein ComEC
VIKKIFIYLAFLFYVVGCILFLEIENNLNIQLTPSHIFLVIITLYFLALFRFRQIFYTYSMKLFLCALLAFMFFGYWRMEIISTNNQYANFYGAHIEATGRIYGEPSFGAFSNRYKIEVFEIIKKQDEYLKYKIFPNQDLIVSLPKYPIYENSQIVTFSGTLEAPENFDNENGIEFDYVNFLRKDNIFGIVSYGRVSQVVGHNKNISYYLFNIKNDFLKVLSRILDSPNAELMGGLLLGVKQSLGDELEKQFRISGLIHVVVLSGFNITIIIVAVFKFLAFLPRLIKYFLGLVFVFCFAMMVGLGATVVRASIMSGLAIFGKLSGRNYNVNRALCFAGLIMALHNPLIIFYDPSFQLSFVASLGLINISGPLKKWLIFIPEKFEAREIVAATVSTQIAVLPMILKMTGELSVVSLPANLIVLPLISLTMLLGFVVGVVALFSKTAGLVLGFFPNLLLDFELKVVGFFAELPFAMFNVPDPGFIMTVLFYCLVVIIFYDGPIQIRKKVIDVLTFSAWLIIGNKSMLPHIKHQDRGG